MQEARLEICWKYYSTETDEALLIWSPCEVVKVADGTSDKASERCKKMLPAGAVLVKWAEDKDREEKETLGWKVLLPKKFNKQQIYSWRLAPCEFSACAAPTRDPRRRNAVRADAVPFRLHADLVGAMELLHNLVWRRVSKADAQSEVPRRTWRC